MDYHKKNGFTLIELLVVIAIISLLLSILLPSLNKVKQCSRRLVCKSNLKSISLGIHLYLHDNNGLFYQKINANVKYGGWEGMIFLGEERPINPYLSIPEIPETEKEADIFKCPEDKGGLMKKSIPLYSYIGTSYQTNHFLIGPNQVGVMPSHELRNALNNSLKNLRINRVDDHSKLVLVGDYGWLNQYRPKVPIIGEWHHKKAFHNVAFLDGHVDFIELVKGLYVTSDYTVLPFRNLNSTALKVQRKDK